MKIGLDISQMVYEGTGVSRFVHGLIQGILTHDNQNEWFFFFSSLRQRIDPKIKQLIGQKHHRLFEYKLPPTTLSFVWNTMHRMKVEKLVGNLDWFISSDWTEPPSNMKKATIIHDLVYLRYPETVHSMIRKTQNRRMHWVKKESTVIFTDSQSTRKDISELLCIDKQKIFVNYPGVDIQPPTDDMVKKTQEMFHINKPFILTVGKIEPRKNIGGLIEAFKQLNVKNMLLVIVGSQGWDKTTSKKQSGTERVLFLDYIADVKLSCLYKSCLFFIYPSFYEGFGYPVIEAMRLGAAVATSNTSSLKEISDGASYLFNPHKTSDIKKALSLLVTNYDIRNKLKKQGIIKSQDFSWKKYIDNMTEVLTVHH